MLSPITTGTILGAVGSNTSSWMNTISITGPNNYNSNDLTLDWFSESKNVKKYEVFETAEDVLALSVTWYRTRAENLIPPLDRPTKLTDEILFKEMIQSDRDRADLIRDYYSKKLMMLTLKEKHFSNFRKDLNTFIHGNSKLVKEDMMPLVYRLPEFYEYDTSTDLMFRNLNTQFEGSPVAYTKIVKLSPLQKFTIKRKHGARTVEYWLKDEQDIPYRIDIDASNELLHLWDHYFESNSVTLDSVIKYTDRDGKYFNKLIKWSIKY